MEAREDIVFSRTGVMTVVSWRGCWEPRSPERAAVPLTAEHLSRPLDYLWIFYFPYSLYIYFIIKSWWYCFLIFWSNLKLIFCPSALTQTVIISYWDYYISLKGSSRSHSWLSLICQLLGWFVWKDKCEHVITQINISNIFLLKVSITWAWLLSILSLFKTQIWSARPCRL